MPYDCHKWSGLKYVREVDLKDSFNGPEKAAAIFAPEVAAAFKNIFSDPANIMKYQSNPNVMALVKKMASKMGWVACQGWDMGGLGGMFGGAGG